MGDAPRTIQGRKDIKLWVNHHNCHVGCKHCFLGRPPRESHLRTTAEVCNVSTRHGFDTHIYTTDQTAEEFDALQRMGKCISPNVQVETTSVFDNRQDDTQPISVTVLSEDPAVHDAITKPGDHACALDTVRQLREVNAAFDLWTVVYAGNCADLPAYYEYALRLGASGVYVNKLAMLGYGKNLPRDVFLTKEQTRRALQDTMDVIEDFQRRGLAITLQAAWGPLLTAEEKQAFQGEGEHRGQCFCPGGRTSFGVDPLTRDVWACYYAHTHDGLRIGKLDDHDGIRVTEEWPFQPEKIGEPCRSCELRDACLGGCRTMAILDREQRAGETDLFAGFEDCPVALGITVPSGLRSGERRLRTMEANGGLGCP